MRQARPYPDLVRDFLLVDRLLEDLDLVDDPSVEDLSTDLGYASDLDVVDSLVVIGEVDEVADGVVGHLPRYTRQRSAESSGAVALVAGERAAQVLEPCRRILEHRQDRVPLLGLSATAYRSAVDALLDHRCGGHCGGAAVREQAGDDVAGILGGDGDAVESEHGGRLGEAARQPTPGQTPPPSSGGERKSAAGASTRGDAVINADAYLVLNGSCEASVPSGYGYGALNLADLYLAAELDPWLWGESPVEAPVIWEDVLSLRPQNSSWWPLPYSGGETKIVPVFRGYDLRAESLVVPRGGVMVFEVILNVFYEILGGHIVVDFNSGAFDVLVPAILITVLRPIKTRPVAVA